MKKGILTSLICFTSMVLFSCGSKTVKVTILECSHCSFENKTSADVRNDFVMQAYIDRGYLLDTDSDLIEIHAGGIKLLETCFNFNQANNKLTIYNQYVKFGDITIKGNAFPKDNVITYHVNSTGYNIGEGQTAPISVENDYKQVITKNGLAISEREINISIPDIEFTYDTSTKELTILKDYCYTNFEITLS